jgi:hypothetical protein
MDSMAMPQGSTPVRSSVPIMGLILMLIAAVVGGVIIGGVVAGVSMFFYLIILMPLLMAAAGGWVMTQAIKMGKVRSRTVALIFGLLIGLIIYGTYRYGEYLIVGRPAIKQVFIDKAKELGVSDQVNDAKVEELIDQGMKEQTGQTGFIGYTILKAQVGEHVRFGRTTGSSGGINFTLSEPLTWGYWLIELLVVVGGAALTSASVASEPYCEQDGKFFVKRSLGRVQKEQADQFMAAAKAGDWVLARGFIMPSTGKGKAVYPFLDVMVSKCPSCNTNPVPLNVVRKMSSKNSGDLNVLKTTLTPEQYSRLDNTASAPVLGMA